MSFEVVMFSRDAHLEGAVRALLEIRRADATFPPPGDAQSTSESLERWLLSDEVSARFVAILGGRVLGHVQVGDPHDYLVKHLGLDPGAGPGQSTYLEVGKLFVTPDARGLGVGAALLERALRYGEAQGKSMALAVLPASSGAIALYRKRGLVSAGSFEGIHGTNLVMCGPSEESPAAVDR